MAEVGKLTARLELDTSKFSRNIGSANRSLENFKGGLSKVSSGTKGLSDKLAVFTATGAAALAALGLKAINSASGFQTALNKYEVLLGSADKARKRVAELTDFAAKTPFELGDIQRADIILQGFGIRSVKLLETIGNAAAISESDFKDLALVFGQLSQSKDLENIRQLVERGVVSFKELREAGIKFAKDGSVVNSVEETYGKIVTIVDKKFKGGMKKLSGTLPGQISTLVDTINIKLAQFAEKSGLLDFVKDVIGELTQKLDKVDFAQFAESIRKVLPSAKEMFDTLSKIITPILEFIRNNPELASTLLKVAAAMVALNLALRVGKFLFGDVISIGSGFAQMLFKTLIPSLTTSTGLISGQSAALGGLRGVLATTGVSMTGFIGIIGSLSAVYVAALADMINKIDEANKRLRESDALLKQTQQAKDTRLQKLKSSGQVPNTVRTLSQAAAFLRGQKDYMSAGVKAGVASIPQGQDLFQAANMLNNNRDAAKTINATFNVNDSVDLDRSIFLLNQRLRF